MFLFSETFFPVSGIPDWAGIFSLVFPLYHLVDLTMTRVVDGDLVKVLSGYDNEWGYSSQMVREMVRLIG